MIGYNNYQHGTDYENWTFQDLTVEVLEQIKKLVEEAVETYADQPIYRMAKIAKAQLLIAALLGSLNDADTGAESVTNSLRKILGHMLLNLHCHSTTELRQTATYIDTIKMALEHNKYSDMRYKNVMVEI
ncbi:MAG: hypothetical protein RMJ88_03400 [Thermogemmata sp.]|nr:hypothetical protein [Thermogemmata sp.]